MAVAVVVAVTGALVGTGPVAAADPPPGRNVDDCFVDAVLPIFARRVATPAERADALALLAGGATRARLVRQLGRSDLWVHAEVTTLYTTILDRTPEPAGLAYWSDRFRAGTPVSDLGAQVWSSPEMRARIVGGDRGVVGSMYLRIIGRQASLAEVDYWAPLAASRGWAWVARQFYRAPEYRGRQVERLYRTVLGRSAEAAGKAFWTDRLLVVNEVELAIQLAGSTEMLTRAVGACPPAGTVARAVAGGRQPTLSDDGSVVAFLSARSDLVAGDTNGRTDLFVLDRATGEVTRVFDNTDVDGVPTARLSGDGSTVAVVTDVALDAGDTDAAADVYLWDRAAGTTQRVEPAAGAHDADVSADGSRVAWLAEDDAHVWDAATGTVTTFAYEPLGPTDTSPGWSLAVALSSDGSTVVWTQHAITYCCSGMVQVPIEARLRLGDVASGSSQTIASAPVGVAAGTVSADGSVVAYGPWVLDDETPAGVYRWERSTGTSTRVVRTYRAEGFPLVPQVSDDGRRIALVTRSDVLAPGLGFGQADLYLWDADRGTVARLAAGQGNDDIVEPALSGDGRHVAFRSTATGLVPDDSPGTDDLFVWDEAP